MSPGPPMPKAPVPKSHAAFDPALAAEGLCLPDSTFIMRPHGFHEFRKTPLLNDPARGFALTRLERILQPEFKGVHAELVGQHVHGAFQSEIDLGRSRTAGRTAPGIVGVDQPGPGIDIGYIVGAGEHEQGPVHHHMAYGIISAFVHQIIIAVSRQFPLAIGPQLDIHFECVALGTHQHAFGKAGNIPDRSFEMKRGGTGNALRRSHRF